MPRPHRSRVLRCLALAASAAMAVPLAAVPSASAADPGQTVVGRLVQAWPEYRTPSATGTARGPLSWIRPDQGGAIRVPTEAVGNLPRGATVQAVLGAQVDDGAPAGVGPARQVLSAQVLQQPAAAAAAAPAGSPTNQVTVVMAVPAGGARDATMLADVVAAVNGPVAQFWSDESGTAVRVQVVAQADWPTQPYTASCTTPMALLDEAQAKSGFVSGAGKHLLVYVPPTAGCADGFAEAGSGTAGGGRMYVTATLPSLIVHEFGHAFGLRDSSALQCDTSVETGSCRTAAGGDSYDVMGTPWAEMGALDAVQAAALGFLQPPEYSVQAATNQTTTYDLLPYGGRTQTSSRAVRLETADGSVYWAENRAPVGQDAWLGDPVRNTGHIQTGVILRRETRPGDPAYTTTASLLLDATPSSTTGWDGDRQDVLPLGVPVRVDGGYYTITFLSTGPDGARLRVEPVDTYAHIEACRLGIAPPMSGVSLLANGSTARAFVVGLDRALWYRPIDGSSGWQSLGGGALYGPASTFAGSTAYVFVVGLNGALFYRADGGSGWGPWTTLGGVLTASPAAASLGSGHVRVFGRGTDGQLWSRELRNGTWSPWIGHGGYLTAPPMTTVDTVHGQVEVVVRGMDGYNYSQSLTAGAAPVPYQRTGTASCSAFAMGAVRSGDDPTRGVYLDWMGRPVVRTTGFGAMFGGFFTSTPAVEFFDRGDFAIVGRGLDGALWLFDTRNSPGNVIWEHTWQSLGGYIPN